MAILLAPHEVGRKASAEWVTRVPAAAFTCKDEERATGVASRRSQTHPNQNRRGEQRLGPSARPTRLIKF
jgi:hypothetical protein